MDTYFAAVYKCDHLLAVETFTSYNAVMAFSGAMSYKGYTTFIEDREGNDLSNNTVNYHRARKRAILMTIGVWKRMTQAEREEFDTITGENDNHTKELIDRLQIKFRRAYF